MRRTDWLLARPWLVVLAVAFLIVLPMIALGEASAGDSQARLRTAELVALAQAAERAAASMTQSLESVARQISAASTTPKTGKPTPLLLAIESRNTAALSSFASYLVDLMKPEVIRIIVLDDAGTALLFEPYSVLARAGDDLGTRDSVRRVTSASPSYLSGVYETDAGNISASRTRAIGVSSLVTHTDGSRAGVVLAELDVHLLARSLTPLLAAADDLYLLDRDGRLVLRATHAFAADSAVGQDLRSSPPGASAFAGAASIEADDPLGGGKRLIGLAEVKTIGWHILALRSPAIVERELTASLDQARLARLALGAILLLGSALFAAIAGGVLRQRRDFHSALQRNVRLLGDLEVKSSELAAASRHKSEFLANMSHELRTPLNAIIGFSEVLEQRMFGELNERQAEYTRDISTSGRHLLTLVNEILDLAKVEAGRMELEPSAFALAETIHGALAFVRERAAEHRITLGADLPPDLGAVVADERKIRQVLLNLLSNAVKFTPDGGRVTLRARRRDGDLEIAVQDSGIGIAPADLPRVFEEFQQVGPTTDRSREGTGLGLTLAKRFVELHGGRIWVESEVGSGTTFTFAIPMEPAPAPQ